ncbi:MAG: DUF1559 domain-containing protein [Gemmatales bacterium]|nr:DUF1559 domain-containing protein [Gemmatales bacterium]MDW7993081.1 DUF1559 domain-containing protein [Gemmatales bacterium]
MQYGRRNARRGLSRRDGLVLLGLFLFLAPTGVRGLQQVRLTKLEIQSANQLRQLAMAFHTLHNDYDFFPTGGGNAEQGRAFLVGGNKPERNPPLGGKLVGGAQPAGPVLQEWGWAYQLLPYLELEQLWRTPDDDQVRQTVVPTYFCPLRRKPEANEKNEKGLRMAGIDYAGNGGVTGPMKNVRDPMLRNYVPPYDDFTASGMVIRSSAWYQGEQRRVVSLDGGVPDGTSNTLLLITKRMQTSRIGKNPPNDDWSFVDGWGNDTIVRYHPEDGNLQPAPDGDNPVPDFAMGSASREAMLAVFADRSLRRIRYTVAPETLAAIMIRNDGTRIKPTDSIE